jgi:hypothetical protein
MLDMKIQMSPNVAVRTQKEFLEAIEFHSTVPGFKNRSTDPELADFDANPINLFVLEANGCRILRWRCKGQDCYIEDPFRVRHNVWEKKE